MMQFIFHNFMILMNMLFLMMNHPMSMGLILLLQTLIMSISSSMINSWYSYMLFIIFIGGMLVLFIYVTSLASNEIFSMNMKLIMLIMIMFIMIMLIFYNYDKSLIYMYKNQDSLLMDMKYMNNEYMYSLIKLYNFPTNMMSILLMIYLLIALIASVKITYLSKGPLRQMFN